MPNFTSDWFSSNIPAWNGFFGAWDLSQPRTIVEIGSYEGRSSLWILDNLMRHPSSKLYCIDVFADADVPDSYWSRFKSNVLDSPHGQKVEAFHGYSFDFLSRFVVSGAKADFVYVDGSHRAADVLEDLILAFRALKPGGVLICDDYLGGPGEGNELVLGTPKIAVDAFTTIYRDRLHIIRGQSLYQLAMQKNADRVDDDPSSRGMR